MILFLDASALVKRYGSSALTWQDSISQDVVLATFDRQLWEGTP